MIYNLKCEMCGVLHDKVTPMANINGMFYCGVCVPKISEEIKRSNALFLKEVVNKINRKELIEKNGNNP